MGLTASKQETTIPLRLWVDKERNRVVVAEASGDFIDILFSFLTLPLGTIIRLVSKNQPHQPVEMGCINNLYQCVESLNNDVFWNHICKQMLLSPRNPCEALCQRLKLKVDDSEPTKYFMCSRCIRCNDCLLSTFAETSCTCGKLMDKEMKLQVDSNDEARGNGVFVKGETMYLIFDDLKVLQSSPGNSVQQLIQLGYKDINKLTEMSPNVGMKEIFSLLKQALTSKSPLSDVFLANGESKPIYSFSSKVGPTGLFSCFVTSVNLKITVSKSKNKILFAEAEEDFVDFLFSFLTTPLGSILNLMDGNLSLGCMDNLYKSVNDLNSSCFTGSTGTPLLNLQVAPQFGCKRQPLKLSEEATPSYWYVINKTSLGFTEDGIISKKEDMVHNPVSMKLFDPRSPDGTREPAVGFVRRPSVFVVWDDLQVTPLTTSSSISFLQKLNVQLDDFEQHEVSIGETQALHLLGASLTSKAALTEGLFYLLKKPKEEANDKVDNPFFGSSTQCTDNWTGLAGSTYSNATWIPNWSVHPLQTVYFKPDLRTNKSGGNYWAFKF